MTEGNSRRPLELVLHIGKRVVYYAAMISLAGCSACDDETPWDCFVPQDAKPHTYEAKNAEEAAEICQRDTGKPCSCEPIGSHDIRPGGRIIFQP